MKRIMLSAVCLMLAVLFIAALMTGCSLAREDGTVVAQDELIGEHDPVYNFETYILPEKNRLRVEYAHMQSFPLDAGLFFETIGGVFKKAKKVAGEHRAEGGKGGEA